MKMKGLKFTTFIIATVFLLFFSNDFGLIDVEKTAIITAVAIDYKDDGYKVTAQIAVPEATDTNTENQRAQISGTGGTVGAAIKNIGDTSGWFPQLAFCNLIILGENLAGEDVIKILDYFSKTLRVQDSALTVMSEGDACDLLKLSTPLDNISSFALQKILLKNAGLNRDVAHCDVKTFCVDYYSVSESSYMPFIKVKSQKRENSQKTQKSSEQSDSSGGAKGEDIFNANTTAIFYKGKKAGVLDEEQTLAFNAVNLDFNQTTLEVKNVNFPVEETHNCLLTIFKSKRKTYLNVTQNSLTYNVELDLFVKISDQNAAGKDLDYIKNIPLPEPVKAKAEEDLTERIESLIQTEKLTGCDFLGIKKELYRNHYAKYSLFKDNFINIFDYNISVNVYGES